MTDMATTYNPELDESREMLVTSAADLDRDADADHRAAGAVQHGGGGGATSGENPPMERHRLGRRHSVADDVRSV